MKESDAVILLELINWEVPRMKSYFPNNLHSENFLLTVIGLTVNAFKKGFYLQEKPSILK